MKHKTWIVRESKMRFSNYKAVCSCGWSCIALSYGTELSYGTALVYARSHEEIMENPEFYRA